MFADMMFGSKRSMALPDPGVPQLVPTAMEPAGTGMAPLHGATWDGLFDDHGASWRHHGAHLAQN